LDDLRDFFCGRVAGWPGYNTVQKYPRKVKPPSRVHARHNVTDVLRCHGIPEQSLKDVFQATVFAKITYCLSAWSGTLVSVQHQIEQELTPS